jgi:catechol 2,3-dioxygenase-like lactoylglutathione lyase family enzyme
MTATFNHIGITLAPEVLSEAGRSEILDFYGDVFGWTEGDASEEPGDPLILYTGAFGQFVFLLPGDPALSAPQLDHVGLHVGSMEEFDGILARARIRAATDPRVRIIDRHARVTHGSTVDYTLTSCYIAFLLPLMFELQHLERHEQQPST